VRYTRHSTQDHVVFSRKEIIISAGTFGSPKLLLNSGIGPTEHLIDAGISPKVNLPVGRNLQDHTGVTVPYLINTSAPEFMFFPERDITLESISEFELRGDGPLTYAWGGSIAEAFLSSTRAVAEGFPEWPDIQIALLSSYADGKLNDPSTWYISNEISIGKTRSRGYLKLNTSNPSGPVDFGFGFFADAGNTDIEVIVEAIRFGLNLFENTTSYGRLLEKKLKTVNCLSGERMNIGNVLLWKKRRPAGILLERVQWALELMIRLQFSIQNLEFLEWKDYV
jgi:choline dehydrogenase-like flavoprotein